nr:MAG TPA: hypothetical protein [Caudoviricetes sp.]
MRIRKLSFARPYKISFRQKYFKKILLSTKYDIISIIYSD